MKRGGETEERTGLGGEREDKECQKGKEGITKTTGIKEEEERRWGERGKGERNRGEEGRMEEGIEKVEK